MGDVVDVATLRAHMVDAVRRAGTGSARFVDADWNAEVRCDVGADDRVAVVIAGVPYADSLRLVADGTAYDGWRRSPGFWDPVPLDVEWAAGDPLRLLRSLPDGPTHVVAHDERGTTYRLEVDPAALAAFCGEDVLYAGTGGEKPAAVETLWTLDPEGRPMSIGSADEPRWEPWEAITFGDWGQAEPVTAPPPLPQWPGARPPGPGELEVHVLAMRLARHVARRRPPASAVLLVGFYPTGRGDGSRTVATRLWFAGSTGDGPHRWEVADAYAVEQSNTFLDALSRQPLEVGGRQPNLLVCHFAPAPDDAVLTRYGWTHHADVDGADAARRLSDPAWVEQALVDIGMTRG